MARKSCRKCQILEAQYASLAGQADRMAQIIEEIGAHKLAVEAENARLRAAIREHRGQRADDRCIEDDDRLYAALGDGVKCDRRVGDKVEMLANCARFIDRRCEGGGWPSYRAIAEENERLLKLVESLSERVQAQSDLLAKRAEK